MTRCDRFPHLIFWTAGVVPADLGGNFDLKTKRELLERAITTSVKRAMTQGQSVDVNALAIRLSSKYPQSGITLDAICDRIEATVATRLAEREGGVGGGVSAPPV